MKTSVVLRVGPDGPNWGSDVTFVCRLLNSIPAARGGTAETPLKAPQDAPPAATTPVDGLPAAILNFQKMNKLPATGSIDPDSRDMFQLLVAAEHSNPDMLAELRARVCDTALSYKGAVSDLERDADGNRKGWRVLQEIFDSVLVPKYDWESPRQGLFLGPYGPVNLTAKQGLQRPNMRVPTFGLTSMDGMASLVGYRPKGSGGVSWCGIFAFFVWRKCGLAVSWPPRIGGARFSPRLGHPEEMRRGDIGVVPAQIHHFILYEEPQIRGLWDNPPLHTIDGNAGAQQILEQTHANFLRSVQAWYSLEDAAANSRGTLDSAEA